MKKTISSLVAILLAAPAGALEWHPLGARAVAMGGAGVACAQGPIAAYWNPAALGRPSANAYGLQIPLGLHAGITGSVIEGANDLQSLKDSASATQAQIDAALAKLDQPGSGLRVDAGGGANLKIGKLALFLNGFADAGAVPYVDRTATTPGAITAGTNNSKLIVKGVSLAELGVGYGHELPFAPGLYLGGALKIMNAKVGYADYFILRNDDASAGDISSKLKDGARSSSNFGVDLGALWDLDRTFEGVALKPRVGLTARNLNNPKFSRPPAATAAGLMGKFAVNPQVRLGASISPFNWWNIASDVDLTRNLTPVDNMASRQLGIGSEFNVFNRPWINIPLRVGLMRNLAESSAGTILTAGTGLNFLHVILDVSGAVSTKSVPTQSQGKTEKLPREFGAAFQLSFLFGGSDEDLPVSERYNAPRPDDQPVPTQRVREASEKAHREMEAEDAKKAPTYAPTTP
ncbi:MAG: conjugal transfer protein TraF [Elusimicrobia bacterium]|nr:conjugal transfer protein TraF [Elusimicrobiota bacterium]